MKALKQITPPAECVTAADFDRAIGRKLYELRVSRGLTQQQLAEYMGVTYQQAHKYEKGINRMSAGRLAHLAQLLNVPVGYFYADLVPNQDAEDESGRLNMKVARDFRQIDNAKVRKALGMLIHAMADAEEA